MPAYFRDKTLLITGAASGIGREIALQAAAVHARLVLMDLDATGLAATAAGCRDAGAPDVHAAPCDVSDLGAMQAAWSAVPDRLRAVDVLFANAGISQITRVAPFDPEQSRRIMAVNYGGSINAVSLVLPGMLARGRGQLVATSSLAGYRGLPGSACYSASKAAQAVFFEGLRIDLRKEPVDVTIVLPGFVDTPINKPLHELYHLPFMMPPARAARRILRGVARRRTEIRFPLTSTVMAAVGRRLPNFVYDFVIRLNPWKKKAQEGA